MLTSPISVTIGGVEHLLPRINQDNFGATYLKKGTGFEVRLLIRHSYEKANVNGQYERHNVDLQYTTFSEDGVPTTSQAYTVFRAKRGTAGTVLENVVGGLSAFVVANDTALVAWES